MDSRGAPVETQRLPGIFETPRDDTREDPPFEPPSSLSMFFSSFLRDIGFAQSTPSSAMIIPSQSPPTVGPHDAPSHGPSDVGNDDYASNDFDAASVVDSDTASVFTQEEALAAAAEGIHYVTEPYPAENSTMSPTFQKEPVSLEKDDRVFLLDEVQISPYMTAMRVKSEKTGQTGLVPGWVVEGALERLARMNMAFNEAATCPAEISADKTHSPKGHELANSLCTLAHRHSRCQNMPKIQLSRRPSPWERAAARENQRGASPTEDEISDDEVPLTPPRDKPMMLSSGDDFKRKVVMFQDARERKIFRYLPAPEVAVPVKRPTWEEESEDEGDDEERKMKQDKKQKTSDESDRNGDDEEDGEWWWAGWEEEPEKPFTEPRARGGRPLVPRRTKWGADASDSSSDED